MYNKYLFQKFIFLVLLLGFVQCQTIVEPDLTSLKWLVVAFGFDWSTTSTTCADYYYIQCITNGAEQYISVIDNSFDSGHAIYHGEPDQMTSLSFRNITKFRIRTTNYLKGRQNLLELINTPNNTNLQHFEIGDFDDTVQIPIDFPANLPSLRNLTFYNIKFMSDMPSSIFTNLAFYDGTGSFFMGDFKLIFDGNRVYPNLRSIKLSIGNGPFINLTQNNFPYIENVDFSSSINMTMFVQSNTITKIKFGSISQFSTLTISSAPNLTSLQLSNSNIVNITDFTIFPKLTRINFANTKSNITNAKNLEYFFYTGSNLTTFPPASWFAPRFELNIQSNLLQGEMPDYPSQGVYPFLFLIDNNIGINGSLHESYCSLPNNNLYFRNTNIDKLPDCIFCIWNFEPTFPQRFPVNIRKPPNFVCKSTLDQNRFIYSPWNPNPVNMTLTGKNLGYDSFPNLRNQNLKTILFNQKYIFNNKGRERGADFFVAFNANNITFSWDYDITRIENTTAILSDRLMIQLQGSFNQSLIYTVTVDGLHNCIIESVSNDTLICYAYNVTNSVQTSIKLTNSIQSLDSTAKIQVLPLVTSTSKFNITGGDLYLYGYYYLDNVNNLNVSVDNINCTILDYNKFYIHCYINETLNSGVATLDVHCNNKTFTSKSILKIDSLIEEKNCIDNSTTSSTTLVECNGNGFCNSTACSCFTGYGGFYCESRLADTIGIKSNIQAPELTISANDTQLLFNIFAFEELNQLREVTRKVEIPQSEWNYTKSTNNKINNNKYIYNDTTTGFIAEVNIDHFISPVNFTFAGITNSYQENSLKLSVTITGWLFNSNLNSLRMLMETDVSGKESNDECEDVPGKTTENIDKFNNLKYIKIVKEGVSYFGRFYDYIISDNRVAYSMNEIVEKSNGTSTQKTIIGINMPQCNRCIIDPDFSALIDVNSGFKGCSKQSKKFKAWMIAIIVGGVALAAAITALIYFKRKEKVRIFMYKLKTRKSKKSYE